MFCPSCGELAHIREGDGETYYERIESRVNPSREVYDNKKPKIEDYNLQDATTLEKKRIKDDYENRKKEWYALDEDIPRFKQIRHGRELMEKGVKYAQCKNPYCEFHGPAEKVMLNGREIDLDEFSSKSEIENRDYTPIKESESIPGVLTWGDYICPKCDCTEVYADVNSNLEFAETAAKMLTCKKCSHGWREF